MLPEKFTKHDEIRIGVLLAPPPVQLLDLAPIDLFHMMSKEYIGPMELLPQPVKNQAMQDVKIIYIADHDEISTGADETGRNVPLTAEARLEINASLASQEVQPGQLTILLIPGPDPNTITPDKYRSFIAAHAVSGVTDIITVCTGIYPACYAGICDGLIVSGPRGLLPDLRSKFLRVKEFADKRWSHSSIKVNSDKLESGKRHSELWTAAGITNGHDCIAAYMKTHFDQDLAEIVCRMADIEDRGRDYKTGQMSENIWWVSKILRTVVKGFWERNTLALREYESSVCQFLLGN